MANSGRPNRESEGDLFLAEVTDAEPLRDRDRTPVSRPGRPARSQSDAHSPFVLERDGEYCEGRAHGVNRKQVADLRNGRVRVEATLDLHRQGRSNARRRLHQFIKESIAAGQQCVLVVHGRGLHSTAGPVLKEDLIAWLADGRQPIRAFCTARPRDGGGGATYVLLRGT